MTGHELASLATEAYLYGYPLVADLDQVVRFTERGTGTVPAGPFNRFAHARALAGPQDAVVSVNNDTLYSVAQLDLGAGPLLLDVPDTAGRYFVLQFVDAWTNNVAYLGQRSTGTAAASYLVTYPGWATTTPPGVVAVTVPTRVATIVGRWACAGPADLPAVHALQDALRLRPATVGVPGRVARPAPGVPEPLRFAETLRTWMRAFPPADQDREYQGRFARLGLLAETTPYRDPPPALAGALVEGTAAGRELLEGLVRTAESPTVNGWLLGHHQFDYNLDFFGPGTIDSPEWKVKGRRRAHRERAVAARVGLWGNHGYEAVHAQVFEDDRGERLTGRRAYTIRFDEPPPVHAFWSLTMYDAPDFLLVDNPISRYSIGDRTPGLRYGTDGSLTLRIQHDAPDDEEGRANWLPAPEGEFRPMLRCYWPAAPLLDGSYRFPPVRRLAGWST